jgi:hypothetical protein
MRAVILRFYNKRLSESRASEQNKEQPMGAGWTAYVVEDINKILQITNIKIIMDSLMDIISKIKEILKV